MKTVSEKSPAPKGWAEEQGLEVGTPLPKLVEESFFGRGVDGLVRPPGPGLTWYLKLSEEDVLSLIASVICDCNDLLGLTVLPKIQDAYGTAEFAEMLWVASAYKCEPGDLTNRDDLAGQKKPDSDSLLNFFVAVLHERTPEIMEHALPRATLADAAKLAEILSLVELLYKGGSHFRRVELKMSIRLASPLQRRAWELRARAWLMDDRWRYSRHESQFAELVDYDRLLKGQPGAGAGEERRP